MSKTAMLSLVKSFKWTEVDRALAENAGLFGFRDDRGRNWLHLCCGVNPKNSRLKPEDSVKTAAVLLKRGFDINEEAFREGNWKATPLWYAIARVENLVLAECLLSRGSDPNYCLVAASWHDNLEAVRLLLHHGADVNDPSASEDESPLLGAVKVSRFRIAEELLKHGADPNHRDSHGMTALHYMLKKGSDKKHFAMFASHGARGDIANNEGLTAADIMRNKRDPDFRTLADQLRRG